jgi:hypothetical protein
MSNYLEEKVLHHTLRGVSYTPPTGLYIALFTSDPGEPASGTEVSTTEGAGGWTNYARQDAAAGAAIDTGWTTYANGQVKNAKTITFPANNNAAASVTVTHIGLFGAATGGNLLYYSALSASKVIQPGDVLSFAINAITVSLD